MGEKDSQQPGLTPEARIWQLIWPGAMAAQAVYVAAKLGLADLIDDQPRTVDDLAKVTKTDAHSLHRLLRALKSLGLFAEDGQGSFTHTPTSRILRTDHPHSARAWAIMLGAPFIWRPSGDLFETVSSGLPSFESVYGSWFFEYLANHPEDADVFNAAMGARSTSVAAIVDSYDFSRFEQIVDVGGGKGELLREILSRNSKTKGILYDFPSVIAGAEGLGAGTLASRCEIRGGDFFEEVPRGADTYVVKFVIHDWDDNNALKILRNCRKAMKDDGTLLVIEAVLEPSKGAEPPATAVMTDLLMMVLSRGRERTEAEFRSLLQAAGFSIGRIIPLRGSSIIEARPS